MISKVLNDISGVGIYPVATLIIFFSIFGFMLVKVLMRKKSEDAAMAQLPLEDGVIPSQEVKHG